MPPHGSLADRLADLEQRFASLRNEVLRSATRDGRLVPPVAIRWAKTANDGGAYPAATAEPNTYPIIFLDVSAAAGAGQQTVTRTSRQSAARDLVTNIADGRTSSYGIHFYLPEGTVLPVWRHGIRWYTYWQTPNVFHVTLSASVASGGTIAVTLPTGLVVTATNQNPGTLDAGRATIYQDRSNQTWYLTAAGTGQDKTAIVTVYGPTPQEATCLWPGKIAVPNESATAYCSDQFPNGGDCWLVVLNSEGGSTSATKASLSVGEHYLGREVGSIADVPVYAIRIFSERGSRRFRASLGGTLLSATATLSVTTTAALDGGDHPGAVTAENYQHLSAANGSPCLIEEDWSIGSPGYLIYQVNHVVKTEVQGLFYDSDDRILQYRTQDITVMHQGDPSALIDLIVAERDEMVEEVTWDFASRTLKAHTRFVYTWPDSEDGTDVDILTAISIPVVHDVYVSGLNIMEARSYYVTVFDYVGLQQLLVAPGALCVPEETVTGSLEQAGDPLAGFPSEASIQPYYYG